MYHFEGTPAQRFTCPLRQDLRKHMICVREVGCNERGERSEALVHRLAPVSEDDLAAFCHGRVCGMHEHMLERFLHCRGALGSGLANELCDRHVPQSRILQVQLEILEVFVSVFASSLMSCLKVWPVFSQNAFVLCRTDSFLAASTATAANSGVFHPESGLAE